MKSGPTLKGCTLYLLLRAAISPIATVVLPTPLPVPAMSIDGVLLMGYHRLDNGFNRYFEGAFSRASIKYVRFMYILQAS